MLSDGIQRGISLLGETLMVLRMKCRKKKKNVFVAADNRLPAHLLMSEPAETILQMHLSRRASVCS